MHNEDRVVQAKLKEIKLLTDFKTYDKVKINEDDGQEALSAVWVVVEKDGKMEFAGQKVVRAPIVYAGMRRLTPI
jgi:hypothetical protein